MCVFWVWKSAEFWNGQMVRNRTWSLDIKWLVVRLSFRRTITRVRMLLSQLILRVPKFTLPNRISLKPGHTFTSYNARKVLFTLDFVRPVMECLPRVLGSSNIAITNVWTKNINWGYKNKLEWRTVSAKELEYKLLVSPSHKEWLKVVIQKPTQLCVGQDAVSMDLNPTPAFPCTSFHTV